MSLFFYNETQETLWVAFAYPNRDCHEGGVQYAKKGWYAVAPGAAAKVYSGKVGGQAWFYYAESTDRSLIWRGDYHTLIPDRRFDLCWRVGDTSSSDHGFRRIFPEDEVIDDIVALSLV